MNEKKIFRQVASTIPLSREEKRRDVRKRVEIFHLIAIKREREREEERRGVKKKIKNNDRFLSNTRGITLLHSIFDVLTINRNF